MAKINFTAEDLGHTEVPDGIHPVIVEKCEIRAQKKNPSANNVFWQLMIDGDEDPSLNGERIFINSSIEKGSGGIFLKMIEGLGIKLEDFDTDDMAGLKLLVETKTRISGTPPRKFVNVDEMRRA